MLVHTLPIISYFNSSFEVIDIFHVFYKYRYMDPDPYSKYGSGSMLDSYIQWPSGSVSETLARVQRAFLKSVNSMSREKNACTHLSYILYYIIILLLLPCFWFQVQNFEVQLPVLKEELKSICI